MLQLSRTTVGRMQERPGCPAHSVSCLDENPDTACERHDSYRYGGWRGHGRHFRAKRLLLPKIVSCLIRRDVRLAGSIFLRVVWIASGKPLPAQWTVKVPAVTLQGPSSPSRAGSLVHPSMTPRGCFQIQPIPQTGSVVSRASSLGKRAPR